MKLIVPNGMLKITIPFRNGVSGKCKNWFHLAKESSITSIGITDSPAIVDIDHVLGGVIKLHWTQDGRRKNKPFKALKIRLMCKI